MSSFSYKFATWIWIFAAKCAELNTLPYYSEAGWKCSYESFFSPYLHSNRKAQVLKCLDPPVCLLKASSSWGPWRRRGVGPPERSAASFASLWIFCSGTRPKTDHRADQCVFLSTFQLFVWVLFTLLYLTQKSTRYTTDLVILVLIHLA